MADGGDTELHHFDSQFRSSALSPGDELGDVGDDTVVMDSPMIDTELVNLDFDTDLVDEEEVVLDSEDESVDGAGRETNGYVLNLRKRRLSTPCQRVEGLLSDFDSCEGLSGGFESIGGKDPMDSEPPARLNCIGSDEPGKSSQASAIGFVDRFVSLNNAGSSEGEGFGKMIKKSPPVSWAKGLQSLAKRLGNQTGSFEWVDSAQLESSGDFSSKWAETSLDHGKMNVEGCYLGKIRGRGSDKGSRNEKKIVSLPEGAMDTGHSKRGQVSQMEVASNSVEDSYKQFYVESSERMLEDDGFGNDAVDMFDVGFNTQMAAEAIEALAHASLYSHCPGDTFEGLQEAFDYQKALTSKGDCWRHSVNSVNLGSCSGLREVTKKSKQRSRSAKRVSRGISTKHQTHSEKEGSDVELKTAKEVKKRKLFYQKRLSCRNSTVKHKKQLKGNSPVALRTRHWMSEKRVTRSKSEAKRSGVNMNGTIDLGGFKIRRKRSALTADPHEVRAREKHCKLSWTPFPITRNSKLSEEEQIVLQTVVTTDCSKLVMWSHPKGKRTHRSMKNHFNGAGNDTNIPFATVDRNQESAQKKQLSVYTRRRRRFSENNTEGGSMPSVQSSKPNVVAHSTTLTDATECIRAIDHTKAIDVSPKHRSFEHHKRPCNKKLPNSSLLKELSRLGVSNPMPDFTWKDLRRPRVIAHVRVLFSQHLGDDIVKQQKKVLSRLGISIASCSTDATHFIADKFARTRNMLESVVLGKPVVTHLWLESCGQAGCLIDEKKYILRDFKKEKEIGFSMPVTLARASQYPLLKAKRVLITPSIKPDQEMITSLVKAACGQVVDHSWLSADKDDNNLDDLLILSCEEDHAICEPFIHKGAAVYSTELLLNGIVTQKLEYERHQLFANSVDRKSSRNRKRSRE